MSSRARHAFDALLVSLVLLAGCHQAWPPPSVLTGVAVTADRDSATLTVPVVAGAADYRAYLLPATARTDGDSRETVTGTEIYCAGLAQHNAKASSVPEVSRLIQLDGLTGPADVVVEAIDRLCPFAGQLAADHHDIDVTWQEVEPAAQGVFSYFTEAEIRAKYGALIVNGQGPGSRPGVQAEPNPPRVIARTTLHVVPTGNVAPLTSTFFDDFSDPNDQPVFAKTMPGSFSFHAADNGQLWQNSKWSIYSYGAQHTNDASGNVVENTFRPFISRGALHMVLADQSTDVFSSAFAYPRKLVHPSLTSYVHATWEVPSNATGRRYWEIVLCGADQPGQTIDANGQMLGDNIQTPFFYLDDGLDISAQGWNCFQIFELDGSPFALPPDNQAPQSTVHVLVNLPGRLGAQARTSVVNVSPDQYLMSYPGQQNLAGKSWYKQQVNNVLGATVLDDKLTVDARVKFDLWLRRDRAVLFVDGQQRLCNDFPSVALTMPEAALGFGQVLYHSSAERLQFNVDYWPKTGQRFYLNDAPFADSRTWDNLGFEEGVASIPGFDESACFRYGP